MSPMCCRLPGRLSLLALLLCVRVVAAGERLVIRPVPMPQPAVTDEQIGTAIVRGVEFLLNELDDTGQLRRPMQPEPERARILDAEDRSMQAGHHALCVSAILHAGHAVRDERLNPTGKTVARLIDAMKRVPVTGHAETYARGIRATALALNNRPEDRQTLVEDVRYLLENVHGGAYSYGEFPTQQSTATPRPPNDPARRFGDNSNSQYGLLGVWAGAEAGIEISQAYWALVDAHWTSAQLPSGQWNYQWAGPPPGQPVEHPEAYAGSFNMTVAGLASLLVTYDWLVAPRFGTDVGRPPLSPPLARGLQWLESADNCIALGNGYGMYGLERVGLASGYKYFGRHDWYRAHAAAVVPQLLNLHPAADSMTVAYWVLFLSRGRHPVLMNKLRFDGFWSNRPRELANLARFAGRELERPVNWQVVPVERDWQDWTDSPILWLASHDQPKLKEGDELKIRSFIDAGGLLFTQADGGRANFTRYVMDLGRRLFPMYEWQDLPLDHEIYSLNLKVSPKPRLKWITNGSRILMLHSTDDLAAAWQQRAQKTRKNAFDLGLNLFIYAAGQTNLRNRLSSSYIPEPPAASQVLRVARVKYNGNWNPEPYAMVRFGRWFGFQTGLGLQISTVELASLDASQWPMAVLTGNAPFTLRDAELAALRKYVEDGGVLLADACGSAPMFDASFALAMGKAFPQQKLAPIPPGHALLGGAGGPLENLAEPLLRPYAIQKLGRSAPRLQMLLSGKGAVVCSSLDITTGLLDTRTWTLIGYDPLYAQKLLKNIVLWTWESGAASPAP